MEINKKELEEIFRDFFRATYDEEDYFESNNDKPIYIEKAFDFQDDTHYKLIDDFDYQEESFEGFEDEYEILKTATLNTFDFKHFINLFYNLFENFLSAFTFFSQYDYGAQYEIAFFALKRVAENILNHSYVRESPFYSKLKSTALNEVLILNYDFNEISENGIFNLYEDDNEDKNPQQDRSIWEIRILNIFEEYRYIYKSLSSQEVSDSRSNSFEFKKLEKIASRAKSFNGRRLSKEIIKAYGAIFEMIDAFKKDYEGKDNNREIAYKVARNELHIINEKEKQTFYNTFKQFKYRNQINTYEEYKNYLKKNGYFT